MPPSHLVHGQEVELLLEVVGHLELPPPGLQGDDLALGPLGQVPLAPVAHTWEIDLNIDFSIVMLTSGITEVFQKERKTAYLVKNLSDPTPEIVGATL